MMVKALVPRFYAYLGLRARCKLSTLATCLSFGVHCSLLANDSRRDGGIGGAADMDWN